MLAKKTILFLGSIFAAFNCLAMNVKEVNVDAGESIKIILEIQVPACKTLGCQNFSDIFAGYDVQASDSKSFFNRDEKKVTITDPRDNACTHASNSDGRKIREIHYLRAAGSYEVQYPSKLEDYISFSSSSK